MKTVTEITVIFMIVALASLVAAFYLSFVTATQEFVPRVEKTYFNEAAGIMLSVDALLYDRYTDIKAISNNPVLKSDISSAAEIGKELSEHKSKYRSLSFYDPNGIKISDTQGSGIGEQIDPLVFESFPPDNTPRFYYSSAEKKLYIASLVGEGGLLTGILVAEIDLDPIGELLQQAGGSVAIFDKNKNVIITNDPVYRLNAMVLDTPSTSEALSGRNGVVYEFNSYRGEDVMTAYLSERGYREFEGSGWYIAYYIDRSIVLYPVSAQINGFVFLSLVIAVAAGLSTYFLSRRLIVKPIAELRKVTKEAALGKEVKVPSGMSGEIGELAGSLKNMVDALNTSRKRVDEFNKTLEHKVGVRTKDLERSRKAMMNAMEDLSSTNKALLSAKTRLRKGYKKLKEENVKKDRFISIAAHELKTPLATIHGFADVLRNEKLIKNKKKRNNYLSLISRESKRLSGLVTDVLDLSRIDIGTVRYKFEKTDMKTLIADVKKTMSIPIKKKDLSSEYVIEKNLPSVKCDREKLTQVFLNLLTNSIKFTPEGKITVKAYKEDDNIHVEVSDTGVGIPKKYVPKLFERFYQVPSEITRKEHGTGLGLSLCKEFIKAHGGDIWVKSKPGKGSTFHFTIPVRKPETK